MPKTLKWGQEYSVLVDVGAIADAFILDQSTLDGTDTLNGSTDFVDITEYVLSVAVRRGRPDQLSQFSPGAVTIVTDDRAADRLFDPFNAASDLYAGNFDLAPKRQVKVLAGTANLFVGAITDVDIQYEMPNLSYCTISGADALFELGRTALTAFTPSSQTTSDRVTTILDRPEVAFSTADRNITSTPTATCGTVAYDSNTNALSALQAVAYAEDGRFYVDRDGVATFDPRISFTFSTAVASFGGNAVGAIPVQAIGVAYGSETLYNRVQINVDGFTTAATAVDTTSSTTYGISTLSISGVPLNTEAAGSALASNLLSKYKDPVARFDTITTSLNAIGTTLYSQLLTLDVGDIISVTKTYTGGSPTAVTQNVFIEAVSHAITPTDHRLTFTLGQAQLYTQFVLDSSLLDGDDRLT
jgi:hypothetical protein